MCSSAAVSAGWVININDIDGAFKDLSCRVPAIQVPEFCCFVPLIDNPVCLRSLLKLARVFIPFYFQGLHTSKGSLGKTQGTPPNIVMGSCHHLHWATVTHPKAIILDCCIFNVCQEVVTPQLWDLYDGGMGTSESRWCHTLG